MLERLLIAATLAAAGLAAWQMFTRWQLGRAARAKQVRDPLLANVPRGMAAVVYFTTPTCAPCRLQQTPTLERLSGELGDRLHVIHVDATEQPEVASRWGVLSVPTVFVLAPDGTPKHVHNGVVSASVLKQEILTA